MKQYSVYSILILIFMLFTNCAKNNNKKASDILGNPKYQAFSYGGYRTGTREVVPSVSDIKEDMRILSAMDIKLLRTYNTSQFMHAANLLEAISQLKNEDPNFEMYVMLGAWIDCKGAWTDHVDHSGEDYENNSAEINRAVQLANKYPDIVKIIAVGNEAMVHWATSYYVQPKIILKWVNHLQKLKSTSVINTDLLITSSDNFASWGGQKEYHNDDLNSLIKAVDFISLHTYPFHETHYNSDFWIKSDGNAKKTKTAIIDSAMKAAIYVAKKQFKSAADYIHTIDPSKEIHIGETGWASIDNSFYGDEGSKAADEYKQKLYYDLARKWTNETNMSCFYFEAFDENWKDSTNSQGSENHFGLINLNGEVKFTLWNMLNEGKFDNLARGGIPLTKTYGGDYEKLLDDVLVPPSSDKKTDMQAISQKYQINED